MQMCTHSPHVRSSCLHVSDTHFSRKKYWAADFGWLILQRMPYLVKSIRHVCSCFYIILMTYLISLYTLSKKVSHLRDEVPLRTPNSGSYMRKIVLKQLPISTVKDRKLKWKTSFYS